MTVAIVVAGNSISHGAQSLEDNRLRNYTFESPSTINGNGEITSNNGISGSIMPIQGGGQRPEGVTHVSRVGNGSVKYRCSSSGSGSVDRSEHSLNYGVYSNRNAYSGWSSYFSTTWDKAPGWFVFKQWHQSTPESPILAFELMPNTKNKYRILLRYGANNANHSVRNFFSSSSINYSKTVNQSEWRNWIVQWTWQMNGSNGYVRLWSGNDFGTYSGPLGYTNVSGSYSNSVDERVGIYRQRTYRNNVMYVDQAAVARSFDAAHPTKW
ncbi:heparin lyase I family protein [Rubellicoccus peritrichatus]|uniref:Uncharacterized protein n=1 Tax=Rubellicoccus peritrichatus TaxID=3080537 RepID=A0AAQ3QXZ9_9BACT|nr:heparin lyase I family protein [Puniceicoccus sp. CR14]WOO43577.1 hypothetical protein RZN69_10805 [Puniceicoccus sp. CR14]